MVIGLFVAIFLTAYSSDASIGYFRDLFVIGEAEDVIRGICHIQDAPTDAISIDDVEGIYDDD